MSAPEHDPAHETEIKLEYETAPFLHSLFANDSRELKYLEEKLGVRSVTRDGWILFAGPERGGEASAAVFADLEQARRQGGVIGGRDFRLAVDLVAEGGGGAALESEAAGIRGGAGGGMKTVSGDLIHLAKHGEFDLIMHGCNCFCTMGAGIAKGIKAAFPAAFEADLATARGDRAKLGTCTFAEIDRDGGSLLVVNAYTQFDYRGSGPKVDYDAIRSCFRWIKEQHSGKRIGLPKIGAGLAGGDWVRIAGIIEGELAGEDVTLVEFAP